MMVKDNSINTEFKVVGIISPRHIILNCGTDHAISEEQEFLVYGLGDIIKDPDTDEKLEQLEVVRGIGRVLHMQNKICTIESVKVKETPTKIIRKQTHGAFFNVLGPSEETRISRDNLPFVEVQIGDKARLL